MKYKCNNEKCPDFGLEVEVRGIHHVYNGTTVTDMKAPCPTCGVIRESLKDLTEDKGFCTHAYSTSGNICKK